MTIDVYILYIYILDDTNQSGAIIMPSLRPSTPMAKRMFSRQGHSRAQGSVWTAPPHNTRQVCLPSALLIRLLISRAGDVESNPGPRCKACVNTLRTSQTHLTCYGCGDSSHKQECCSGLSRTAQGRVVWT